MTPASMRPTISLKAAPPLSPPEATSVQWCAVADQNRPEVATIVDDAEPDMLSYMTFPKEHRAKLHSTFRSRLSTTLPLLLAARAWRLPVWFAPGLIFCGEPIVKLLSSLVSGLRCRPSRHAGCPICSTVLKSTPRTFESMFTPLVHSAGPARIPLFELPTLLSNLEQKKVCGSVPATPRNCKKQCDYSLYSIGAALAPHSSSPREST